MKSIMFTNNMTVYHNRVVIDAIDEQVIELSVNELKAILYIAQHQEDENVKKLCETKYPVSSCLSERD